MLAEQNSTFDKKKILNVLGNHPSDESARAAAQLIGDFFCGKEAAFVLREMGAAAEDAVLKHIVNPDNKLRGEAYLILGEIGTKKSLGKLKSNLSKERDRTMKEGLKEVISQIQTRLKDDSSADDSDDE